VDIVVGWMVSSGHGGEGRGEGLELAVCGRVARAVWCVDIERSWMLFEWSLWSLSDLVEAWRGMDCNDE